jgi:hypothetical protein
LCASWITPAGTTKDSPALTIFGGWPSMRSSAWLSSTIVIPRVARIPAQRGWIARRALPRCPIVPREQGQEPDEAGRVDLDRSTFSLPEVLGHALTLVRGPATRYGVGLSLEVERGVGAVTADKRKVTQP